MYKIKYIKNIIFLFFLISAVVLVISASSAAIYEPTKKIDSGKKTIKLKNEKYQIKWETEQVLDQDKEKTYITYKSTKNKKNHGYVYITLDKTAKNNMNIYKSSSSMRLGADKIVTLKTNTSNYYWKKLRPKIANITKKSISNSEILKYNKTRYFNKTINDPINKKKTIIFCQMNWKVYYYTKTSSIEIEERFTDLSTNKTNEFYRAYYGSGLSKDLRIDKYSKGKLRITTYPYNVMVSCGPSTYYKYVKTNLTPKQYFLKVYKKKIETKKLN